MNVLAIDVGTSSVKAAVLDVASRQPIGPIARHEYALDQPDADTATIPPERLWQAVKEAVHVAREGGGGIDGIGFSVLTPGLILLDEAQQPLTPIVTHLDRRSRPEARQAWADLGERYLQSAGNRPLPGGISATSCKHLLANVDGLRGKVRHYLHVNGWLAMCLTGHAAFDLANASFTGLLDATGSREWSTEWCDYFGVDLAWLPRICSGDITLGQLRADVARELGLPSGLPVKIGTADTSCAMLAADMTSEDLLHVVGTTQVLAVIVDRPAPSPVRLTRLLGVGKRYVHVTHNPVGGVALDWVRKLCFHETSEAEFYGRVILAAAERTTDVFLDPPFLGGDRLEIEPRRAGLQEMGLHVDRLDVLAAVLQALQRCHRQALANLGVAGPFRRIFLSGGGDAVRRIIPEYAEGDVSQLEEASLRGVAAPFASSQ